MIALLDYVLSDWWHFVGTILLMVVASMSVKEALSGLTRRG